MTRLTCAPCARRDCLFFLERMCSSGHGFQPYRLALSRCYDQLDPRISCLACHNPHKNDQPDPAYFDSKCIACHAPSVPKTAQSGWRRPSGLRPDITQRSNDADLKVCASPARMVRTCRVGKQLCVSCHMPKYEIPGSHFKFTDHDIRVVRAGEPYPN